MTHDWMLVAWLHKILYMRPEPRLLFTEPPWMMMMMMIQTLEVVSKQSAVSDLKHPLHIKSFCFKRYPCTCGQRPTRVLK